MKILIFGAGGMIGHKMYQRLSPHFALTYACVHRPWADYEKFKIFNKAQTIDGFDVSDFSGVQDLLMQLKPDVILNCIGITIRKEKINDFDYAKKINSDFPHLLKDWVDKNTKRLIHFSTDCVFDGHADLYTEASLGTASDNYGQTKYWGEVQSARALTLRSSMIGYELYGKTELLEWLISQKGKTISGYSRVMYSGLTTDVMAGLVLDIIRQYPDLSGLYQVASQPISKYELLVKLNDKLNLGVKINEDQSKVSRKILDASLIWKKIGFVCPSWDDMISQLAREQRV